jgi:hypothetical protein
MNKTVRRTLVVTVAAVALAGVGSGLAFADTGDDSGDDSGDGHSDASSSSHTGPGTGNGLSGGPTYTQVLKGAPAVPLTDPTLGEGTLLPPVYNAIG